MKTQIDRRSFLKGGAAGVAAAAVTDAARPNLSAADESEEPVRIGVVGVGGRGRWHIKNMLSYQQGVVIPAICDYRKDRLAMAVDYVKNAKGYTPDGYSKDEHDYRNMLERDDLDGVLLATDVFWLGKISIDAMKAGKHVGHEVAGCHTIEECHGIVEEHERSGKHCMLLENCCYGNETMMAYNMVRQGVFGDPYFGVGSYVHDCRKQFFDGNGKITWRGELWRDAYGSSYDSHALGSPAKWLGINDGDRFEYCTCMMTRPKEAHEYAVKTYGPDSEPAKVDFKTGDFVTTLIYTAKGRQIRVDYSLACTRPYSRYYLLQGTKGSFDSRVGVYLKGISGPYNRHKWDSLEQYYDKWQHSYWRKDGEMARRAGGHGGIDYFVIYDFLRMVRTGEPPWIDAYDAAGWSSILHCSHLSLDRNGAPVDVPDFTKGKWKNPNWRKGRLPA